MSEPETGVAATPFRVWTRRTAVVALIVAAAALAAYEGATSRIEARVISRLASGMTFALKPGPTDSVIYPDAGPYDIRRGYVRIPAFADTLRAQNFVVAAETRFSPALYRLTKAGAYPIYREKTQAGLRILDHDGRPIYSAIFPERVYASFDSIPPLIVKLLLFIENRELLSPGHPYKNPAVEWDRLGKAVLDLAVHMVFRTHEMPGGSTLATQIEKFRHSDEGRTSTPGDKLRQMVSASLRSYLDGEDTEADRRRIVLDFVNSVPLAAMPGYGEVNGLGDGLWAWYDADIRKVDHLLRSIDASGANRPDIRQARALKQVLSLFIAHRRPSTYLLSGRDQLRADTDAYLRLLARRGVISEEMKAAALPLPLPFRSASPQPERESFIDRKAANAIRTRLLALMDLEQLYDLDRVDLIARTTLDRDAQTAVTRVLTRLKDPAYADSMGLRGDRLLITGDPAGVIYSFTLYERTPRGNLLRVQADNLDEPLDINEGVRLDLGSTAKLRTLVTYLEIVWKLHDAWAGHSRAAIRDEAADAGDPIRRWALDWLGSAPDTSLSAMLDGAMARTYSGNPGERFFTGGGLHSFVNFEKEDNGTFTVEGGLKKSVNLVFIRLMRDIVRYYMADLPDYKPGLFEDRTLPQRQIYLSKFADKEGRQFLARFWSRYRNKSPEQCLATLVDGIRPTPKRLAVIYRSVKPNDTYTEFRAFLKRRLPGDRTSESAIERLYASYAREAYDLADRGYIAKVHPLELWLVEYLYAHPGATWSEVVEHSAYERQVVYKWLFKTRYTESQNTRIRILLEEEAFRKVHESWRRQGYPFGNMTPSYASAIGSSADRPAALAELMGIIVNNGIRRAPARIDTLHLAPGTPYEMILERTPVAGQRVYPPELTRVVRRAVIGVVEGGTAARAYRIFMRDDGTWVPVGGKTGTGDHRYETFGKGGVLLESRVVNRTGTFVFLIGDRFFGTLSAHVPGPKAARYKFTSALPVQILKILAPSLRRLVMAPPTETPTAATGVAVPVIAPAGSSPPDSGATPPDSAGPGPSPASAISGGVHS